MSMRRVLFVDDEENVLHALKLLLRSQRRVWDMVFVANADLAIAELEKAPFDVIVSDMRMPKVDGAELLTRVHARWPATARLVLSGYADSDAIEKVSKVAQTILSKPCELDVLRSAIEQAMAGAVPMNEVEPVAAALAR